MPNSRLALPSYESVKHLDGKGNYAVSRYYKWPFAFFYQKKLKMILDMMNGRIYENILDYGAGPAHMFSPELKKHCYRLVSYGNSSGINKDWRFSAIVCASVLEFTKDPWATLIMLDSMLKTGGHIYIASPMSTPITRFYFKLIGDKQFRWPHFYIKNLVDYRFKVEEYQEWNSLYFALRARKV